MSRKKDFWTMLLLLNNATRCNRTAAAGRHSITIILLLISLDCFCQYKNTSSLIRISDSVLIATIGTKYIDYYKLDTISSYEYNGIFKRSRKRQLKNDNKVKGKFKSADLRYKMNWADLTELSSTLYISVDKNGKIDKYTEDVPRFVLENRECDYIPKSKIVEIGDSLLKEKGIRIDYKLYTDYVNKKFVWEINNIIRDCTDIGFMDGLMEIIKIDPITGEILEHCNVEFGHVF